MLARAKPVWTVPVDSSSPPSHVLTLTSFRPQALLHWLPPVYQVVMVRHRCMFNAFCSHVGISLSFSRSFAGPFDDVLSSTYLLLSLGMLLDSRFSVYQSNRFLRNPRSIALILTRIPSLYPLILVVDHKYNCSRFLPCRPTFLCHFDCTGICLIYQITSF